MPKLKAAGWDSDSHSITDYIAEKVRTLFARPADLRVPWADASQRADRLKRQHVAFFKFFAPEAREILDELPGNHDSRPRKTLVGVPTTAQSLGALLKSVRDIMRKVRGSAAKYTEL